MVWVEPKRKKSTFSELPEGKFKYQGVTFDKEGQPSGPQGPKGNQVLADAAARFPVGSPQREQLNPFTSGTQRLSEIKKALKVNFLTPEMVQNYEAQNKAYEAQTPVPQNLNPIPTTQAAEAPQEAVVPQETGGLLRNAGAQIVEGLAPNAIKPLVQPALSAAEQSQAGPAYTAGLQATGVMGTIGTGMALAELLPAFNTAQVATAAKSTGSKLLSIGNFIGKSAAALFGGGIIKSVAVEGAKETAYNFEQSVDVFNDIIEQANQPGADLEELNRRWLQNVQYMQELGPIIAQYSKLGHTSEWWYKAGKLARTYNTFRFGDEAMGQPSQYQVLAQEFERAKQYPNPASVRKEPFKVEAEGGLFGIW